MMTLPRARWTWPWSWSRSRRRRRREMRKWSSPRSLIFPFTWWWWRWWWSPASGCPIGTWWSMMVVVWWTKRWWSWWWGRWHATARSKHSESAHLTENHPAGNFLEFSWWAVWPSFLSFLHQEFFQVFHGFFNLLVKFVHFFFLFLFFFFIVLLIFPFKWWRASAASSSPRTMTFPFWTEEWMPPWTAWRTSSSP
ncbi:hypothetical protein TRFO_40220 [Tritrichomonas foetus]|uniref:Uncharacterized protein n=1 Tax=Tritrichomonas foetus TaxID=1144522 RepID=A0A1J4J418_9EUKA|nr:hypothetical protein TRFO_40220 [Tritrichomonas foetus]|eukprot:OHS93489.1 hypothetical protein TRFO_40220 [Tritrichomonas foetus]